jgi:hypothetical protein
MANLQDLHAILAICGITDDVTRALIVAREGFTQLDDLGVLETDTDVMEMAKRMASCTQAEGRVLLGTVIIKRLQTLIWWVCDQQKRGLALNVADFTAETMNEAAEMKGLRRERAEKEPSLTDLGKFDPDDFDAHEDAFLNLLAQSFGVLKEPLQYAVHLEVPPDEFATREEERTYQFPLTGSSFELDNQTVYRKLKAFLIDSPGWAWIEPHDNAENGRGAYLAWVAHYNGEGELSKRTAIAKEKLDTTDTDFWRKAVNKEMAKVKIAWKTRDNITIQQAREGKVPDLVGLQEIGCHIVFNVKMDFTRKARFMAGSHTTSAPSSAMTYSSVVSRDSIRLAFLISALIDIDIMSCNLENAYLNVPCREKIWF